MPGMTAGMRQITASRSVMRRKPSCYRSNFTLQSSSSSISAPGAVVKTRITLPKRVPPGVTLVPSI